MGTTVLSKLKRPYNTVASILCGSLSLVFVNMKSVYKCECVIKCKILISLHFFKKLPDGVSPIINNPCLNISTH